MAEKPILFNTKMVQTILGGRKTQTRRLIKAPVLYKVSEPPDRIDRVTLPWADYQFTWHGKTIGGFELKAPYHPGDVLWVRETWKQYTTGTAGAGLIDGYLYKADEPQDTTGMMVEDRWHPSIHMPREAARLFLRVKDVRIERLQDISVDEIRAEGLDVLGKSMNTSFRMWIELWNSTVKKADLPRYGWEANPWVWVIEFLKCGKWGE